jgi:hypothetical protein
MQQEQNKIVATKIVCVYLQYVKKFKVVPTKYHQQKDGQKCSGLNCYNDGIFKFENEFYMCHYLPNAAGARGREGCCTY